MKQRPTMSCGKGFTLLEIILAIFILGVAIVPMVDAFIPAIHMMDSEEQIVIFANQARGTLNRVTLLDFSTLNANQGNPVDLVGLLGSSAEAAKEGFSFKGESHMPLVSIADVSGGTGGLLEIMVAVEDITLKTLKSDH